MARGSDSPGRARYRPSNHCAGRAGVFPLHLYARVRIPCASMHTRPRVQRAPGLPCALCLKRARTICKTSGKACRENDESYLSSSPPSAQLRTGRRDPYGTESRYAMRLMPSLPTSARGYGFLRSRRSVRGKNSRVATSACSDCVRSLCWHSRLKTSNLSHLNHLSPFPGQPCRARGEVVELKRDTSIQAI